MRTRQLGIEEEFLLFRPDAPELLDVGPRVVASAAAVTEDGQARFEKELKTAQAELASEPADDLAKVADDLAARRNELVAAARRRHARVVAAGTCPVPAHPHTTDDARYREMEGMFGEVAQRQLTCAMHVHVAIDSPEEGVRVINGSAPWLPVLTALSANSPFYAGRDTGYASFRRMEWGRWPTAGPAAGFTDAADYRDTVERLVATGAARDEGMIYFDARLSAKYPTVEIRVCDVCTELETAVALAALVRALVTTVADGPAPEVRPELLRAADWRAARFGMTERLVDLTGAARLAPAWDLAQALLDVLTPALDTAGDTERVTRVLDRLRAEGTGAERQRAAVADAGDLGAAVDAATLTG